MRSIIILLAVLLVPIALMAQFNESWVATYNGPYTQRYETGKAVAVDAAGNTYVVGQCLLGSGYTWDMLTIKYNNSGETLWVAIYNGPDNGEDYAYDVVVDASGNVYVCGASYSVNNSLDFLTIKYNSNGETLWTRRNLGGYPNTNRADYPRRMVIDGSGNVIVTGESWVWSHPYPFQIGLTIKYSPSGTQLWAAGAGYWEAGVTLKDIALGTADTIYVAGEQGGIYRVVKYSPDGIEQWNGYHSGGWYIPGRTATAVAVDGSRNVYVTGVYAYDGEGTVYDFLTAKFNASGTKEWVSTYNGYGSGYDQANDIVVDGSGNVYVTGQSTGNGTGYDYATIKYNSIGEQQWVTRHNGPGNVDECATTIGLDPSGNPIVTGYAFGSGTGLNYTTIKYNVGTGIQDWISSYNGPANDVDQANDMVITSSGVITVVGNSRGIGTKDDVATVRYNGNGTEQWVSRFTTTRSCDYGRRVAYDAAGNVYVTGYSSDTTNTTDYITVKYNAVGVQQWIARYNGTGNSWDKAYAIAVDAAGNVYVTGESYGSGNTGWDCATIKYNSSGDQLWVARWDCAWPWGWGYDRSIGLGVDASGNVYIIGQILSGDRYFLIIKYNSSGELQWNRAVSGYEGPLTPTDIAVDGSGNVYATGYTKFGNYGIDFVTVKYNTNGDRLWTNLCGTPSWYDNDYAYGIAVDVTGNVYVTGSGFIGSGNTDYMTVKLNSSGAKVWDRFYSGTSGGLDVAYDVAIDASGNIVVTGASTGSGSGFDYATVKYDPSGTQLWATRYNGPGNSTDQANAIALDGQRNVYVTGQSTGSGTNLDYATIKYDSSGNQLACQRYNGPANLADYSVSIAADATGNAYITGYSAGVERDFDIVTIKYQSLTPPEAPVLVTPANEATNQPISGTLTWNTAARATSYDVYLDVNNPPTNKVSSDQTDLTFAYSSLANNTTYYWKVVAKNAAGSTSSAIWIFTTIIAAPGAFSLSTPLDDAVNVPVEGDLTWQASERVDHYEVTLGSNTYTVPGTSTSYHYSGLSYSTDYVWNVTAINIGGSMISSNGPFSFTTIIEKPATFNLTAPLDDAVNVPIEGDLTWDSSTRADYYEVAIGGNTYTVMANFYHYGPLSYLTSYEWNVTAYNVGGNTISSNGPFSFTTITQAPEPPELVSPTNGSTIQPLSGTLTWNPAVRAENYDVYFGTDNPPATKVSENQTGTTYNYSVSLNEQTHYWQIVAKNIGGSTSSLVWSFTTGRLDVGVTEITEPSGIIDTLPETPEATVQNFGTLPTAFSVYYVIRDSANLSIVYSGTATVTNLLAGDPLTVEFPIWNRPTIEGCYYSQCYTQLTNDANPTNDLANSQFAVEGKSQQPINWTQRPNVPTGPQNRTIMHGACLATDQQGLFVYLLKGNNTGEFYRYDPGNNTWTTLDAIPSLIKEGGTLTQVNGKFYATTGGNTVEFWEYDPNGSPKWTQKANVPAEVHSGASSAGVMINGNSCVYLLRASVSFDFFRYNISTNTWETMASAPYVAGEEFKKGSSISYDGTDTIYVLKGIFNNFYAYVVSTNTWLTRPNLPLGSNNKSAKGGADILYHMRKVYCIKGSNSQEFWVYRCSTGVWIQDSDVLLGSGQNRVDDGGSMIYSYYYRYLYITKGHSLEFLSYGQLSNYAGLTPNPKMNDNTQSMENGIVINYELKAQPSICHDLAQVSYALPTSSNIMLKLYDATGREIRTLAQGAHEPGRYKVNLNTHTLAQGIYYLRYESGTYREIKKLIIQR